MLSKTGIKGKLLSVFTFSAPNCETFKNLSRLRNITLSLTTNF